jgi:hypothetical protein
MSAMAHRRVLRTCVCLVLALGLMAVTLAPARADKVFTTPNGYTYSVQDARAAYNGVRRTFTDDSYTGLFEPTPDAQMPVWDRVAHYIGPHKGADGRVVYVTWVNERYAGAVSDLAHADPAVGVPIVSTLLMSAMDSGLAGPKWKSYFDKARRDDKQLPASVQDRYTNVHKLVVILALAYVDELSGGRPRPSASSLTASITQTLYYGDGLIGYAQAGVGSTRIAELTDFPQMLATADAQAFIDDWFDHFGEMLPDDQSRSYLAAQRHLLVVDKSFDRAANLKSFEHAIAVLIKRLTTPQMYSFLLGGVATQAGYNAAVLRERDSDAAIRPAILQFTVLDATLPRMAQLRANLAAPQIGDWASIQKASDELVNYILEAR